MIERKRSGWRDRARRYRIEVDGLPRGTLKRGETVEIEVEPGYHEVALTVDWASSPTIGFDLEDGDSAHLLAGPGGSAWRGLKEVVDAPSTYISLERR